jgi:hypothetical protein
VHYDRHHLVFIGRDCRHRCDRVAQCEHGFRPSDLAPVSGMHATSSVVTRSQSRIRAGVPALRVGAGWVPGWAFVEIAGDRAGRGPGDSPRRGAGLAAPSGRMLPPEPASPASEVRPPVDGRRRDR